MQTILLIFAVLVIIYLVIRSQKRVLTEEYFLSIVNHVFRTPLTRIKWMSDKLKEEMPRKDELELISSLENATDKLLGIVEVIAGIKDVNNISSYDLRAVSIREILENSISRFRTSLNEKHINISLPSFTDIPLITVDTKKISFVIDSIIENAIFYGKINGKLIVDSELKDNKLILKVSDDGIGLSRKDKNNIFRRFYRGERAKKINTDGIGLSLYLAREIVKRHGGNIKFKSGGINRGSTFYIILPIKK